MKKNAPQIYVVFQKKVGLFLINMLMINTVAVQETGNHNIDSISLRSLQVITDPNNTSNKGSALYIKRKHTP